MISDFHFDKGKCFDFLWLMGVKFVTKIQSASFVSITC